MRHGIGAVFSKIWCCSFYSDPSKDDTSLTSICEMGGSTNHQLYCILGVSTALTNHFLANHGTEKPSIQALGCPRKLVKG